MNETLTIALPKGRLLGRIEAFLTSAGMEIGFDDRKLVATDATGTLRAMLVKNSDLPTYVHHGIAGLGICGTDGIYESACPFFELMELPFGSTRMCLAARTDHPEEEPRGEVRVATKFTRFAQHYFMERGISAEVIRLGGSPRQIFRVP